MGKAMRNKKLGQNFLLDKNILNKELKNANVLDSEIVLEIGGGKGVLTEVLLKKAKKVICIEIDKKLVLHLKEMFENEIKLGKLELIEGDCLKVKIPYFDKCVANIPYSLSSPLIFHLLKFKKPLYLMMQKEFAERLFTGKGERSYSALSAVCSIYFEGKICFIVSKHVFRPKPKVDSAFVYLCPKEKIIVKKEDEKEFIDFLHKIFCHKKQNLKKNILATGICSKEEIEKIQDDFDLSKKVYHCDVEEIYEIYKKIKKNKN
ncbi:MAG: ribosomal RNA small subunit methyltransferase A [Candidatus Aenigmarchaeota archaeon]|nr:ribosomal RNA small subunit methyltransferase A [Candidatus Aenigmarchaeota archaeon]